MIRVIVNLIRYETDSVIKNIEIPSSVFKGVDLGDFITVSQVIDDWLQDGYPNFVVWQMQVVPCL